MSRPKRHHYVPVSYLKAFAAADGQVWAYRKSEPLKPFRAKPSEVALERYYYSQPRPDGGRDDETLEQLFGTVETPWPRLAAALEEGDPLLSDADKLFAFLALMRVRGPASRDVAELLLAEQAKATAKMLEVSGRLPPPPDGLENMMDRVQVAIDPHMSLHAMPHLLRGVSQLLEQLGFVALHNETDTSFITSDNPLIYFDPDVPEPALLPYTVRPPQGAIELLFPVSPSLLLQGRSSLRSQSARRGVLHATMKDRQWVKRANRLTARFGYRLVIASHGGLERLVARHAAESPVALFEHAPAPGGGHYLLTRSVFGLLQSKPKWSRAPNR